MSPARGDGDFERWLEQELRRTVVSVRGPSPRAEQAAYRAGARPRGRPLTARPALLSRGAVVLLAAALTVGGASAVAMGAGSRVPAELARSVAQIVHGCWAEGAAGGQTASPARHGGGACAPSPIDHAQGGAGQQPAGGDAGSTAGPAPAAVRANHGQGGEGHGGSGQDSGQRGRPSPEPSDRGHAASRAAGTTR